MSTVVLVRPGCTDFDDQCRIQGSLDLPLNQRGVDQLQEIVRLVSETPVEVVYAAPVEPSLATAEAIAAQLEIPLKQSDGLRNLNQGLWEGLPVDEVRRKHPKVFKQWKESPETICPPDGEAISAALERIQKVLEKPLKRKKAFTIVASEPLATLISCCLRGSRPEFSTPVSGNMSSHSVEIIESDAELRSKELAAPSSS